MSGYTDEQVPVRTNE